MGLVVHLEGFPDDVRVAAQVVLPEVVREDEHRRRAVAVFAGPERAAESGMDAEEIEERRRDHAGADADRVSVSEESEFHVVVFGDRLERAALGGEVADLGRRELGVVHAGSGRGLAQHEQAPLVRERKRPEENRVDGREERRVDADAEPQRRDRDGGGARALAHHAPSVAQILRERFEPREPAGVDAFFLRFLDAPELDERPAAGFLRGNSRLDELGGAHVEMETDLRVELAAELFAPGNAQNPGTKASKDAHDTLSSPASRSTRPTASERRCQFSVSRSSWLRPARVSV